MPRKKLGKYFFFSLSYFADLRHVLFHERFIEIFGLFTTKSKKKHTCMIIKSSTTTKNRKIYFI